MKVISNKLIIQTKKNYLTSIVFARAICCLGIIIFHYFCHSNNHSKLLLSTSNSNWGFIYVTCFFSISGIVLYYNYPKNISIKKFYFKRWKSIFPAYYVSFLYFYQNRVFHYKKIFYFGNWKKLIFTLFGIDGYLNYKYKTYYIMGEWFTGAIVIIYILYPIIMYIFNKNKFIIPMILFSGFIIMIKTKYFKISSTRNLITCLSSFYFGIFFIRYKYIFLNKIVIFTAFCINIFLYFKRIHTTVSLLIFLLQGFTFLIILAYLGIIIMRLNYNIFLMKLIDLVIAFSYFIM